ncbi:GGDEF domain-containing protein [Cupriavidus basilensis]
MPDASLDQGRAISLRLNMLVRATPCPSEPDAISYTVSVGMAEAAAGRGADALMRRADNALYDAKTMGRNSRFHAACRANCRHGERHRACGFRRHRDDCLCGAHASGR